MIQRLENPVRQFSFNPLRFFPNSDGSRVQLTDLEVFNLGSLHAIANRLSSKAYTSLPLNYRFIFCGLHRYCWEHTGFDLAVAKLPHYDLVAEAFNVRVRTICNCLKRLSEDGLISIDSRPAIPGCKITFLDPS